MTRLTLVRHGTTEWIEQHKLHGIKESPLSEKGKKEALAAAYSLKGQTFDAFYCSPLGRTKETAEIIAGVIGMKPLIMDDLIERNFGWYEGLRFNPKKYPPLLRTINTLWAAGIMSLTGESRNKLNRRLKKAAAFFFDKHPGEHVLAVIHQGVRNNLLGLLEKKRAFGWKKFGFWPAGGITTIELTSHNHGKIIELNKHDHLN